MAVAATATSPLGVNLAAISYYTSEQPLLDIFKTNGGWTTHSANQWDTGEEGYIQTDSDGYPTTLRARAGDPHSPQLYSSIGVVLELQGGRYKYPAGSYVVLYDGEGLLAYGNDAVLIAASPGRDVIRINNPSDKGIELRIIETDPKRSGNYLRNIRVVQKEYESSLGAGRLFNPLFLTMLKNFKVLRFMDWSQTNGNKLSSWADRPLPSNLNWTTNKGVPLEVILELANTESADPWLNIPVMADDDYIEKMAGLVHGRLGGHQRVYLELSNEVWNSAFPQYEYAGIKGKELWPNRPGGENNYEWNRNWYGMRVAQMCDTWHKIWGKDAGRVYCVLGAQAALTYSASDSLDCKYWTVGAPCARHGVRAVAIAPYFGDENYPAEWMSQPDSGVDSLFRSLYSTDSSDTPTEGWFKKVAEWETAYQATLDEYHLPMIAYEGGQGFVGGRNATASKVFAAANRDRRMGIAYSHYLDLWKAHGGRMFVAYNDIGAFSQYGEWGALESLLQLPDADPNATPKWDAIQRFIVDSPCWWPGCDVVPGSDSMNHQPY